MPKVCFWATSFQADNQAFAHYLGEQPGFQVVVALERPETYLGEPVNRVLPVTGRLLDRGQRNTRQALERFAPDLVIVDNNPPPARIAPKMLVLWHGFGWRLDDLSGMRQKLEAHVGDVGSPLPVFRWAAFGEWDRRYRIEHSGLAPENVMAVGSPYSDLLLPDSAARVVVSRELVQPHYSIDICAKKTVTLGLTWHHGGALSHWGDDAALLARFCALVGECGANLLVRMHDRHRYEKRDIERVEGLSKTFGHVQVKFKSEHPDSLVDLLLTDVLVSNYSSLLNPFYFTGKPSVHIDPSDAPAAEHYHRFLERGRLRRVRIDDPSTQWKLSPDEIGGLRARSFEQLCDVVVEALGNEQCCEQPARSFCERYVTTPDGRTCERLGRVLEEWL